MKTEADTPAFNSALVLIAEYTGYIASWGDQWSS